VSSGYPYRELLARQFAVERRIIKTAVSAPNTIGNAETVQKWLGSKDVQNPNCVIITMYWHIARASLDFAAQHLHFPFLPVEAIWLAAASSDEQRTQRRRMMVETFGQNDFASRVVIECNGIADKLRGAYNPLSK